MSKRAALFVFLFIALPIFAQVVLTARVIPLDLLPYSCEGVYSHTDCVDDIPSNGLLSFHETDTGLFTSGGNVTEWQDQHGTNNLIPVVGSIPVVANAINGLSALNFTANNGILDYSVMFPQGAADRTLCGTVNYTGPSVGGGISWGSVATNSLFDISVNDSSKYFIRTWGSQDDASTVTATGWALQCVTVSSNTMAHYINNTQIDTATRAYQTSGDIYAIGWSPFRLVFAAVWDRALSTSELTEVWEYQRDKYDLSGTPTIPPVALDDSATVAQGGSTTVSVLANDTDADGTIDTASITLVAAASNGTCTVDGSDIDYTHNDTTNFSDSCTYTVDDNAGNTSNTATVSFTITPTNPVSDTEYGPTVVAGAAISTCPNIPSSFTGTVYQGSQADTAAKVVALLPTLNPGDAIIVPQGNRGFGWNITIPSSASGTASNKVYLLSETVHGAELSGSSMFDIEADHIVVAGFKRFGSAAHEISADNVRTACNYSDMNGVYVTETLIRAEYPSTYDDYESDNNTIVNAGRTAYHNGQCSYYNQPANTSCVDSNRRHWLHHNSYSTIAGGIAEGPPFGYVFYFGTGWIPTNLSQPATGDDANRQEITFENNYINWRINQAEKVTEVKSSGNIIRNNCFDETGPPSIRTGNDNLITGNWIRKSGVKKTVDDHGWGNITAFNYYSDGGYQFAIDIWKGVDWQGTGGNYLPYTWAYGSYYNNTVSHNVYNKFATWIRWEELDVINPLHYGTSCGGSLCYVYLIDGSPYFGDAQANTIANNKLYYAGTPTAYTAQDQKSDGTLTHAQFKALNPAYDESSNVHVNSELDINAACGTPNHVNGVSGSITTHSRIKGGVQTVSPPSWW